MEDEEKESLARAHFPYRAEYCKTNRAKCKKCAEPMLAESVKLAILTKSRFHDGYDANFHHVNCFFRMRRPTSVAEIAHFETLKYEDQKTIEQAIETNGQSLLGVKVEEDSKKGSNKKRPVPNDIMMNYEDFLVEYAKSNRSKCKVCDEKIEKESVRLGKKDYDAETPANIGPVPRWYHVDCFAKSLDQLGFMGKVSNIPGFCDLEEVDRKFLKKKIKPPKQGSEANVESDKKPKIERSPESEEEERLLKKQSDRIFKLREFVSSMRKSDIVTMLESMEQKSDYKSPSMLIDMATDILMFGPIKRCPGCKQKGGILLRGSSYICTLGNPEAPCTYETREPKRDAPDVPEELIEKYEFFQTTYKFRGGQRLFSSKLLKAVQQKEAENNNIVSEEAPLQGLNIGITSWNAMKNEKSKIQKKIITSGGKLVTALDSSVFVILTNKNELDKDSPKIEVAKALGIPFVADDFLFNIKTKKDVVSQLSKYLIQEWDGDLNERYEIMSKKSQKTS